MKVTPERWRQIRALFEHAFELRSPDRQRFLDDACGDDPELRRQVDSLLVASGGSEEALGEAIHDAAAGIVRVAEAPPERIGPYRILDTIGEGGMGLVLLAERADAAYEHRVAIKRVRHGLTGEEGRWRFERERQILADLDHPSIARLVDGGTSDDGVPYLVMDYVEGRPIDAYCDDERLTAEARIRLFLEVRDAVAHAHHRLVVHRDLKPSNILVDSAGRPRLLDFGIAKLLDPEAPGAGLTRTGMVALTPEYASPEQVLGEPVTTASDVYSLGVLLYHLLVGRSPYGDSVQAPAALVRAICEERPERPSEVRRGSKTPRAGMPLQGMGTDLDWILLTALRKEPERRYGAVEELADDLRRLLEARPVHAHPDSWHYRGGKWLRRHWTLATAAVLVIVALTGGVLTRTIEARRAARSATESAEMAAFLRGLFESANPYSADAPSGDTTARELLDRGAERVREELAGQPEVQARMAELIAGIYLDLALPESAGPLIEMAAEARSRRPVDPAAQSGNLMLQGRLAGELGETERAIELHRQAVDLARQAHGPNSPEVAVPLYEVGTGLVHLRRLDEARPELEQVLAIRESQQPPDVAKLALVNSQLGRLERFAGNVDEAVRRQQRALDLFRQAYGGQHPQVAGVLGQLASLAALRGDFALAASTMEQVLAINRPLLGDHPTVALELLNLGSSLLRDGKAADAETALRDALVVRRRAGVGNDRIAALTTARLGRALSAQGAADEAATLMHDAARMAPDYHLVLAEVGEFLLDGGDAEAAEGPLERRLELLSQIYSADHWQVAVARCDLGACRVRQGRLEEGEELLRSAFGALSGDDPLRTRHRRVAAERIEDLRQRYESEGRPERAEELRRVLGEAG